MRGVGELVLTLGALLGSLGLLVVLAGLTLDVRPLVFRSGSMAPAIDTGALALVRTVPAADLRVGDVVSVVDAGGTRVTHRVVSLASQGDQRQLTLRGDANRSADREIHTVSEADRVIASVPRLGYVLGWMSGRVGMLLLGLYGAFLASVLLRGRDDVPPSVPRPPPPPPPPPPARGKRRAVSTAAGRHASRVLAMAVVGGAGLLPSPASANWTDGVDVTSTSLAAVSTSAPATFTCGGLGVLSVTFNWSSVAGATSYTLHYGSGGAQSQTYAGTSATLVSAISGGTAWVTANFGPWSSGPSTTRGYTVAVVSLCG
ncbi:signal peptidase I [Nocardioides psychrotolerans]|uniref:Signal peptidase I n=1 Tax=Nocardioides psychrotolerans TaxID=1005945 RepID=A0A1I3KHN5_9ACTN|nr:signal peptidase I [Nocardioides psychrotolerans]SFI72031.1 signal peptidase I [Nocardioides psychrotolerans]